MSEGRLQFKDLIPALGFSGVAAILGVAGYMGSPDYGEMAVVYPPGWTATLLCNQSYDLVPSSFPRPNCLAFLSFG